MQIKEAENRDKGNHLRLAAWNAQQHNASESPDNMDNY